MRRVLKPGDTFYLWDVNLDKNRNPIIVVDDEDNERPLCEWHEMVFQFYGHVEEVRNVNGVDFIIRNMKVFAYSTQDPGMQIRPFYPDQCFLARFDGDGKP